MTDSLSQNSLWHKTLCTSYDRDIKHILMHTEPTIYCIYLHIILYPFTVLPTYAVFFQHCNMHLAPVRWTTVQHRFSTFSSYTYVQSFHNPSPDFTGYFLWAIRGEGMKILYCCKCCYVLHFSTKAIEQILLIDMFLKTSTDNEISP